MSSGRSRGGGCTGMNTRYHLRSTRAVSRSRRLASSSNNASGSETQVLRRSERVASQSSLTHLQNNPPKPQDKRELCAIKPQRSIRKSTTRGGRGKNLNSRRKQVPGKVVQRKPLDYTAVDSPEYKVFRNPMLFDEIASYLDHGTLKELSKTGRLLRDVTRGCKQYISCTQLNITTISRPNLLTMRNPVKRKPGISILKSNFFPWNNVNLDLKLHGQPLLKIIKGILSSESVRSLQLNIPDGRPDFRVMHDAPVADLILSVHHQKFKSLVLDINVLRRFSAFLTDEVKNHLSSLDYIRVIPHPCPKYNPELLYINENQGVLDVDMGNVVLASNITALSTVPFTALRTLKWEVSLNSIRDDAMEQLIVLVERNKNTLTDLSLHGSIWKLEKIKTIVCPLLRTFNARASSERSAMVSDFIKNQRLLQNLSVNITGIMRSLDLPNTIRDRSSELKKLSIRWVHFVSVDGQRVTFDWSYLLGLTHLEELVMDQTFLPNDITSTLGHIIRHLPPTVRKVAINGVLPALVELGGANLLNAQVLLTDNLTRLTRLTSLDFMNVRNSVSDNNLQWIFANMLQLQEFGIQTCDQVTDFGITGKLNGHQPTGFSLASLKGLRKLSIMKCRHLTFEALYSVVAHVELKQLSIMAPPGEGKVAQRNVIKLVAQNPSLEVLKLGCNVTEYAQGFPISYMRPRIQKHVPRFKSLELLMSGDEEWLHLDFSDDEGDDDGGALFSDSDSATDSDEELSDGDDNLDHPGGFDFFAPAPFFIHHNGWL